MRVVAAIPAVGLLAGAAVGLLVSDLSRGGSYFFLIVCAALAWWAWRSARSRLLAAVVAIAFFLGGALLGADAWQRAWRPSLRIAFETLARDERARAAAEGRRLPEDGEAFAIVEGTLRSDASLGDSGVSLSVAVDRLVAQVGRVGWEGPTATLYGSPISGGIILTVVG